jgi:hypothetical protein
VCQCEKLTSLDKVRRPAGHTLFQSKKLLFNNTDHHLTLVSAVKFRFSAVDTTTDLRPPPSFLLDPKTMLTRCFTVLCLAFSLLGTLPCVYAAADTKVANRTIERVSPPVVHRHHSHLHGETRRHAFFCQISPCGPVLMSLFLGQTVQLRTHSIHPPYIDEDLQNR